MQNKVKKKVKTKAMEKLGMDKYVWSFEIQTNNIPSWTEAFDYAYKLGYTRGTKDGKDKD